MRILHTSDLHLGRSFHGRSLFQDQEALCREIIEVCEDHRVGAVLIAGDVYDQASPRTDVIDQFSRFLGNLRRRGIEIVITSGNHDSPARLGFASELLSDVGVHLRTRVEDINRPVTLNDGTLVYGVPYLDPRSSAPTLGAEPTHPSVLTAAVDAAWADRQERSAAHAIIMAHCFASGGVSSESERTLEAGNLGVVSARIFERFDYAALGHLHGRQKLLPNVRYSGSPLAFSFSEARHTKGYWLIDTAGTELTVEAGQWRHTVPLARISGTLEELLASEKFAWAESCWCQVKLTDMQRPAHPMERLRTRFPETLELGFTGLSHREESRYATKLAAVRTPLETCSAFYEQVRGRELSDAERGLLESGIREAERRLAQTEAGSSASTEAQGDHA
ncbi:exonuclease SbcCD subunit D [Kocuria sp. HSID16901]|uniref:exonuclease SbcCD subunit D n=1 Tax=Kocuria sp. HSID16901 TaxID=2419505 RepID=UPI00066032DF|nr:exonuclease SbcCD subunit D [Kocuria sp. HSID16901]RUQ22413.1 exonuclease SbcCD subunit D [Kocuria sp. HSID16901]